MTDSINNDTDETPRSEQLDDDATTGPVQSGSHHRQTSRPLIRRWTLSASAALLVVAALAVADMIWWRRAGHGLWWFLVAALAVAAAWLLATRTSRTGRRALAAGIVAILAAVAVGADYLAISQGWLARQFTDKEIAAAWEQAWKDLDKAPQAPPDFTILPRQYPDPAQKASTANTAAPVGACAQLGGTTAHSTLSVVPCDSERSNVKIIQQVSHPRECVRDADQSYYHNGPDGQWTACLDYAWQTSRCLAISPGKIINVACGDPAIPNKEKPVRVFRNVNHTHDCAQGGFAHPVRLYTICTETQP